MKAISEWIFMAVGIAAAAVLTTDEWLPTLANVRAAMYAGMDFDWSIALGFIALAASVAFYVNAPSRTVDTTTAEGKQKTFGKHNRLNVKVLR